jgi:hypothetical protein
MTIIRPKTRSPKGVRVNRAAMPGMTTGGNGNDRDRTCDKEVRA